MSLKIKVIPDHRCDRCQKGNVDIAYIEEITEHFELRNYICLTCLAIVEETTLKAMKALQSTKQGQTAGTPPAGPPRKASEGRL